ncbi:MAG TPA: hypothetical protein DF383_13640 [Deltaproteobacteria bacterium]|nr:hypothetical protein [Deltaproteobacteria bacterium]
MIDSGVLIFRNRTVGIDVLILVVAIAVVRHVTGGSGLDLDAIVGVSKTITVGITIECQYVGTCRRLYRG